MAVVDLSSPNWYTQVRVWLGNADETQEHYYEVRGGGFFNWEVLWVRICPNLARPS